MAYTITLFVRTSESVAQRAAGFLIDELVQRDPSVAATAIGDGVGWASFELVTNTDLRCQVSAFERDLFDTDLPIWPLAMTLNTRPDSVRDKIAWGLENGGPPSLNHCDGCIELTLVGHLQDWDLIELICDVASERWNAVVCDEIDGFRRGE